MNKIYVEFLQIIRCSLYNENIEFKKEENIYWNKIFNIARRHKVLPMVYTTVCNSEKFESLDLNIREKLKLSTNQLIIWQTLKRKRFLQVYKEILKSEITPLAFKGVILTNLYSDLQQRIYDEEDILIKKENIDKCEEILLKEKFVRLLDEDRVDVRNYLCKKTGLHIQLHTILFTEEFNNFQLINNMFDNVFENSTVVNIDNNKIYTLSVNHQFLYIILYEMNHFFYCGMRVRQLCDITMYINFYNNKIDWEYIWENVCLLGYETLLVNILEICVEYLGLDENYIKYMKNKDEYYINKEDLLGDIIDGGIYGLNSQHKFNLEDENYPILKKSNLKLIFIDKDFLKEKYSYLKKHPLLLTKVLLNLLKKKFHTNKVEKNIFDDDNSRKNLLKKYKIPN